MVAKCARSQETRPLEPDPCADAEINSQPPDSRTWHGSAKGRRRWHFLYVQLYVTVIQDYVALALFFNWPQAPFCVTSSTALRDINKRLTFDLLHCNNDSTRPRRSLRNNIKFKPSSNNQLAPERRYKSTIDYGFILSNVPFTVRATEGFEFERSQIIVGCCCFIVVWFFLLLRPSSSGSARSRSPSRSGARRR